MSGCTLQFARNSPLRTTLVDEATGHVMYKIDTPIKVARSVTRIRKFDTSAQPPPQLDHDASSSDSGDDITDMGRKKKKKKKSERREKEVKDGDAAERELVETSDEIARIYWKWFSSDRIIFGGRVITRKEFLIKCGKAKGSYKFTGPDGIEYRWAMGAVGMRFPKLVAMDEKKTVLATFHRSRGHRKKKQKARLEIEPAGMEMLDYIVLTFVFAEQKRRERAARRSSLEMVILETLCAAAIVGGRAAVHALRPKSRDQLSSIPPDPTRVGE